MASLAVTFTDNGDGTVTVTTATATATAGESLTTKSLTQATNVVQGWVFQSMPTVVLQ